MRLGFGKRLALFLATTLIVVQALTGLSVYTLTREALIVQGKQELSVAATSLVRQLDTMAERVADGVAVLALDYALRQAIALRDHNTVTSALRNHGRRIGATRMLLIGLDEAVDADTGGSSGPGQRFPFPALLESAAVENRVTAVVALDGRAYWMVVVPILAPAPIAFVAAGIPLDDALLATLRDLSALPTGITLVTDAGNGAWAVVANSAPENEPATVLPPPHEPLPTTPLFVNSRGRETLVLAAALATAPGSRPVVAVLSYPLEEALRQYRPIFVTLALLLAGGLAAALVGTALIARGVARPIEALAVAARRMATGDYRPPPALPPGDELGQLASALGGMAQAIAEREERIRHQAIHDATTGLLNRLGMEERIAAHRAQQPTVAAALLMVGFGRFREIVKTVGHGTGESLMRDAGGRLRAMLPPEGVAGRIADTALAIWLPGTGSEAAVDLAKRVVVLFEQPYQDGDLTVDATATIGVALHPAHGGDANGLLQHAEVALYAASVAEDRVAVYDPATDPHRPERLSLMSDLREALERDELRLFYQPKLDLAAGCVVGAEALVRWHHVKRGFVPPDAFIGLAEETGNIQRLTRWALATGVARAAAWRDEGLALRAAINLSVRDLVDTDLPNRVRDLLGACSLPADRLVLEVTESAIMSEPDAGIAVLKRLADLGIDLAIDDFGAGQSSFTYLRRLPVRELKIDKSFVLRLAHSPEDQTIVRSIVELGHRLGYHVTAEGVEDSDALALLAGIGCDHAQGYHIARPLPADDFGAFLRGTRWPLRRLEAVT